MSAETKAVTERERLVQHVAAAIRANWGDEAQHDGESLADWNWRLICARDASESDAEAAADSLLPLLADAEAVTRRLLAGWTPILAEEPSGWLWYRERETDSEVVQTFDPVPTNEAAVLDRMSHEAES